MTENTTENIVADVVDAPKTPLQQLADYLAQKKPLGDAAMEIAIDKNELCLTIDARSVLQLIAFLRDDPVTDCQQLMDVTAVDYPAKPLRFQIVYNLLSLTHNHRIRVKTHTDEENALDSVCALYPSANWFEREVFDMFGVYFNNHPDLRRILTDYGFEGHPLRKDFPLTGYVELRYDAEQKRCVYEPVKLTQDFRTFDFLSPWEGMTTMQLPGDEKAVQPKFNPLEKK